MRNLPARILSASFAALALAACTAQAVPPAHDMPVARCMNLGNALEAPMEGEWGLVIQESDFAAIAREGFDTVRLPVAWSEHLGEGDVIDPAFLARVDEVIRWGLDRGLNVIVDVHHFWELNADPQANLPRLHHIWAQLSEHYRDWPDGLIFELINEPHDNFTQAMVNRFNAEAVRGIRLSNPDRWIVAGGAHWGGVTPFTEDAEVGFAPVTDTRVIATFHSYTPFDYTHQGAHWMDDAPKVGREFKRSDVADMRWEMEQAARFRARTGMPILLGEFGAYIRTLPQTERAEYAKIMRREAEAAGIPWCYWDWKTEFAYADKRTGISLRGMHEALFGE